MANEKARKYQYGKESLRGTAVAATKIIPATAVLPIQPDREAVYPREDAGVRADAVRSYLTGPYVQDKMTFDSAPWQVLPMLFSCSLQGGITPTEVTGGQGDYKWTYDPALDFSADPNQDTITLERGDDQFCVETEYVMFRRIRIQGVISQDGSDSTEKIEAEFFGRQNTKTTFTASLAPQAVNFINSKLTRLFLDDTWAGIGTTEKTHTLRSYDLDIISGLHPKFYGSGVEVFDAHGIGTPAFLLSLVLEGNANAEAIYDDFLTQKKRFLRLQTVGPQIGTGTPFSRKIDLAGTWEKPIPLSGVSNGNNLFAAVLHGHYDVTAGKLLKIDLVTNGNTI